MRTSNLWPLGKRCSSTVTTMCIVLESLLRHGIFSLTGSATPVSPSHELFANDDDDQEDFEKDAVLCIKSDGEPALVAIQEEVRKQRIDETLLENSLVGDSRSSQSSKKSLCKKLANRAQNGVAEQVDDGRKAYHRLRGKGWNQEMVEFGDYRINRGRWMGRGVFHGCEEENRRVFGLPRAEEFATQTQFQELAVIGGVMQKGCCKSKAYFGTMCKRTRILVKFVYDGWTLLSYPSQLLLEDDGPKRRRAILNKEDLSTSSDSLIDVWAVKQSYRVEILAHTLNIAERDWRTR